MKIVFTILLILVILALIVLVAKHFDRNGPINTATKTCLITGASSGIGEQLALEMVKRGWKVIGVARRADVLDRLSKKLGEQTFIPFVCDVSNLEQVHAVSDEIKTRGLHPTLFFLNAGTGELEPKWTVSTASHQRTYATNYFGVLAWVEEWLPTLKQLGGGTFVATSSVQALLAMPGSAAYSSSKQALVHCFAALRRQYLYDKIGFSVVLPGPVDTDMLKVAGKKLPFIHKASDEAQYIVKHVFSGTKQIEPSCFYATLFRLLNLFPDAVVVKW